MWIFAQAEKLLPTPEQITGWTPAQLIQWILVTVLICVAAAAYYGMRMLTKSNDAVNTNYERSLAMWEQRFRIQDERHVVMLNQQRERDVDNTKALGSLTTGIQTLTDAVKIQMMSQISAANHEETEPHTRPHKA